MSEKEAREFDRKRLVELYNTIDPSRNEHIAREAVTIANKWLTKAENQSVQIKNLENRAQRMRGEWIRNDNGTYSCSVCHSWVPEEQHYYAQYCLHCGADMRGGQDDR